MLRRSPVTRAPSVTQLKESGHTLEFETLSNLNSHQPHQEQVPMDIAGMFDGADDIESYPAGTTIFSKGDSGKHMFVILEGEVELKTGDALLNTLGPGSMLGVIALISQIGRSATAVAKTDCRLAPISERRFLFLVQQTPFFALQVMRALAEQLVRKE